MARPNVTVPAARAGTWIRALKLPAVQRRKGDRGQQGRHVGARWRRGAGLRVDPPDSEVAGQGIARFVGHDKLATAAGYVKRLGRRPDAVAKRAAAVLDGQGDED